MPTATFDAVNEPSPIALMSLVEDIQQQPNAGIWTASNNARTTWTITGTSADNARAAANTVVDNYNETHTGKDYLSCRVA